MKKLLISEKKSQLLVKQINLPGIISNVTTHFNPALFLSQLMLFRKLKVG